MSFPSCIKIPSSKNNLTAENINRDATPKDSITYEELISIANLVFGEGRWSHSITSQTVDFVEYIMGKYHIGCAAFVRVQLADGTFHEDMGYSNTESCVKGSAIQSARSLSIAIALKKALLCFGDIMKDKIGKYKRENCKLQEIKINELPMKMHKVGAENSTKESKTAENIISFVKGNCTIKQPPGDAVKPSSEPKRNESPGPIETNDDDSINNVIEVIMEECQEPENVNDRNNLTNKNVASSLSMSEEEIRLERKRKQKQKQEEYKKLMKEKLLKTDDKPNPRF